MARELVRTGNFSLALHALAEARQMLQSAGASTGLAVVLNEIGVIHLQANK